MSVRKRTWGDGRTAWLVCYKDGAGKWKFETFARRKDADQRNAEVTVNVARGIHTAVDRKVTVASAAKAWLDFVTNEGRERSTIVQYKQHVDTHILPRIGGEKLATLTAPRMHTFRDDLVRDLSRPLAEKILTTLKMILKDAVRRGALAQNVGADVTIPISARHKRKLKIGTDIPTSQEITKIIATTEGRGRALVVLAAFTGLRRQSFVACAGTTWTLTRAPST